MCCAYEAVFTAGLTEVSTLFDSIEHRLVPKPLGRVPVAWPKMSARHLLHTPAVLRRKGLSMPEARIGFPRGVYGYVPKTPSLLYLLKSSAKHKLVTSIRRSDN